ncbi:hypothetical protein [Pantoea sp. R13S299]|uniref:hypothetical protein n=1 Tax=Pantoea sp. R13S299 TaxID=3402751 RepID=UPI003AD9A605
MSDAIKEIAGVLKDALVTPVQEAFVYRARNPFFGTMVIAWLFYNWNKVAFFFLSDFKIIERIEYIRHKIPDNSVIFGVNISHTHSFWFPFLWACFISLTFPFFTYASIWVHKKITTHIETINSQKEIKRIQLQKDLMVEMAKNESAKTKQLAEEESLIEDFRQQSATSRANIQSLKKQRSDLDSEIESLDAVRSTTQNALNEMSENLNKKKDEYNDLLTKYDFIAEKHESIDKLQIENNNLKTQISLFDTTRNEFLQEIEVANNKTDTIKRELEEKSQAFVINARKLSNKQSENNDLRAKLDSFIDGHKKFGDTYSNIFLADMSSGQIFVHEPYYQALNYLNRNGPKGFYSVSSASKPDQT